MAIIRLEARVCSQGTREIKILARVSSQKVNAITTQTKGVMLKLVAHP